MISSNWSSSVHTAISSSFVCASAQRRVAPCTKHLPPRFRWNRRPRLAFFVVFFEHAIQKQIHVIYIPIMTGALPVCI